MPLAFLAPVIAEAIVEWRKPNGTAPKLATERETPENGAFVANLPPGATPRNVSRVVRLLAKTSKIVPRPCEAPSAARGAGGESS